LDLTASIANRKAGGGELLPESGEERRKATKVHYSKAYIDVYYRSMLEYSIQKKIQL
jgi:hypothetical protein